MRNFVPPSKSIPFVLSACLLALILTPSLARGDEWQRWPAGNAGHEPLLDARFRSADRKVEFAVTAYYVRMWPQAPEARRIAAAIAPGEKVVARKKSRKQFTGEHGDYWLYDEETTVAGNGRTRYLLNSFFTSNLPGASSELWEFRAMDEESLKRFSAIYKRFKDSLEIGED